MAAQTGEWIFRMAGLQEGTDSLANSSELAELLSLAKAGDPSAFRLIILRHQRQVLVTAWRLLGSLDLAQDATQEVFLRVHKYLSWHDEARKFSPWLYQLTINVCRDMNRQRRRVEMLSLEELQESGILKEAIDPSSPEKTLTYKEEQQMMAAALRTLPPKEREALVLRDIQGLSTGEVARILGSSETTVRSQVSTARVKIKRCVERWLETPNRSLSKRD